MGTSKGGGESHHVKVFAELLHTVTLQKPGGLSNTKSGGGNNYHTVGFF